jgi:hypothetical protein
VADNQVEAAASFVVDNWEGLGVQEHGGFLHMPANILRRNKAGGVDQVPIMLRNVTNAHRFSARVESRQLALELKLDLDRDQDQVEQLENYALLAYAIRDPKTYDQHVKTAKGLLQLYETQSLTVVWGVYNTWIDMLDPRFGSMDAEQLWQVIVRVAREKTPAPLVAMPGPVQFTCIVLMAQAALLSPSRPSWLQSSETSTPAS